MNPPPANGKKNNAKTKIFACLCPCSVFEYVDTDSKKKESDVGKCSGMDPMQDPNMKPTKDPLGKPPMGMPSGPNAQFGGRSPCTDAPNKQGVPGGNQRGALNQRGPSRGFVGQQQNGVQGKPPCKQRGEQMPNGGDSLLKKPLKIVVEEVDCSKMDFSHCNKPCCPPPPCPPPCPPPNGQANCGGQYNGGGYNDNYQQQGPRQSRQSQVSTGSQNRQQQQGNNNNCNRPCCQPSPCPPPPCPPPCPPPTCMDQCGQIHEMPQKQDWCPPPPCPEVTKRFEMRLDKSGKLMNQCTPAGAPQILKVEKDESCSNETIIKITYCAPQPEGGGGRKSQDDQDKPPPEERPSSRKKSQERPSQKEEKPEEEPAPPPKESKRTSKTEPGSTATSGKKSSKGEGSKKESKRSTSAKGSAADDEFQDAEDSEADPDAPKKSSGSKKKSSQVTMLALGAPGLNDETSASSIGQILAIQSTEAILQKLAQKSRNFGIRSDEFEAITSPSDLSNLCATTPQNSVARSRSRIGDTRARPRLRDGRIVKRKSDPLAHIVKERRLIPESGDKNKVHAFLGQSAGAGVQMRRRNMRVYCTSSIKREVRPSAAHSRFRETTV